MAGGAPYQPAEAQAIIRRLQTTPGAALPILHDLMHAFGHIPDDAIGLMAEALNISKAEALGVVTFYPDFRRTPVQGRELKLCRAESCQAMGCEDLVAHLETRHGLAPDQPDPKGALHIETVYCLGHCALSPAAMLEGEPIGRLDADRLDAIVAEAAEGGAP